MNTPAKYITQALPRQHNTDSYTSELVTAPSEVKVDLTLWPFLEVLCCNSNEISLGGWKLIAQPQSGEKGLTEIRIINQVT